MINFDLPSTHFTNIVKILREKGGLNDTVHVTIEESLAMFLYVFAHNLKFRIIEGIYIRSTEQLVGIFLWC